MHFSLASYSLALLAGLLSTLSACVLPIVPILLGSAMNAHRRAPIALDPGFSALRITGASTFFAGVTFTNRLRLRLLQRL
jgi:cytochrome c-type biogenesis protein